MKKFNKIIVATLMAVIFAFFVGMGIECMIIAFSFSFGVSLDANAAPSYPGFEVFCRVAGFLSIGAMVGLAFLNVKLSDKLEYTDKIWKLQTVTVLVLSLPMMKICEMLIDFLRKIF
jgi:hypothetical protein